MKEDVVVRRMNRQHLYRSVSNKFADSAVELQALLCRLHSCGSDIERVELTMDEQGYRVDHCFFHSVMEAFELYIVFTYS